jgi:hypothetical protein
MKSAYELAMERLNKQSPTVKLTAAQKAEIAEAEKITKAKIAERELAMKNEMDGAAEKQDFDAMFAAEERFKAEKKKLEAKLDETKDAIRNRKG